MELSPKFLEENDRKVFAVLRIEEYEQLMERLEDIEDLSELYRAKEEDGDAEAIPFENVEAALAAEREKLSGALHAK